jgi:hypothetical protein
MYHKRPNTFHSIKKVSNYEGNTYKFREARELYIGTFLGLTLPPQETIRYPTPLRALSDV